MKRFIDYSLREFIGGSSTEQQINLSKFARARLTKFLKGKKYKDLVRLSKLKRKPRHYMKSVDGMIRDWEKQELPNIDKERKLFMAYFGKDSK